MKKVVIWMFALTLLTALTAGCGNGSGEKDTKTPVTTAVGETAEETETAGGGDSAKAVTTEAAGTAETETTAAPHYRDIMVPYDELPVQKHLVILQNTLRNPRDGFYTEETAPVPETIAYKDGEVQAYAMDYVLAFLTETPAGELTVTNTAEEAVMVSAEEFAGMYVIIDDFQSGNPPVLVNPDTGLEIPDFFYAVTAEGEGIVSVVTGTQYAVADLLNMVGWDAEASYTVCATDKFHIPVEPDYIAIGDIRGTLSGAVSGSFGDMTIASGKIGDVVIIQPLEKSN